MIDSDGKAYLVAFSGIHDGVLVVGRRVKDRLAWDTSDGVSWCPCPMVSV